VKYTPYIHT